jgi:two-component system response regulator MprA
MVSQRNENERKPIVLIVDDEPQIIHFMRIGFNYEGFAVTVATTGPDALRCITEQQPDLVILDIMLPGLDGMEVAHRIREVHDMAIIMVTANDNMADRIAGLNIGADDYITKPFVFKELMARARAVMRRRGLS